MAPNLARRVPKELAEKFDEVVAGGPSEPVPPGASPGPAPAAVPPDRAAAQATAAALAELREAFEDLRDDVRQGLAAAAQVQFDALAPLRTALDRLIADASAGGGWSDGSGVPLDALRDEMRHLSSVLNAAPAVAVPPDLGALRAQLEVMRQDIMRDRGHRDALRASVLEAVGSVRAEVQGVRSVVERSGKEAAAREADIETMVAGLEAGLKAVRQALDALQDERERESSSGAQHELVRTLEAFHDELVDQWRERKVFEASVPPVLEGMRRALTEGMSKVAAGVAFLPVGLDEHTPGPVVAPASAQPPADDVLREVAALRGELADRAGQLDEFLRTAVAGANRWFIKMRDDLYARIDGDSDGDRADVTAAVESLQADVKELHSYLGIVDSNLQRFHEAIADAAEPAG
ncbi:MAG: hypothetical protein ACRD2W_16785 [Acidimicrobiales bacterium]